MAHGQSVRNAARALLQLDYNCEYVARTLYVPYATVKRWRKEIQEERQQVEQSLLQRCKAPAKS